MKVLCASVSWILLAAHIVYIKMAAIYIIRCLPERSGRHTFEEIRSRRNKESRRVDEEIR